MSKGRYAQRMRAAGRPGGPKSPSGTPCSPVAHNLDRIPFVFCLGQCGRWGRATIAFKPPGMVTGQGVVDKMVGGPC